MMNNEEKRAYELAQRTATRLMDELTAIEDEIATVNAEMNNILQGEMNPEAARELQRMSFDMIRLTVDRDWNAEQLESTRAYLAENERHYNEPAGIEDEDEHEIRFLWNGIKVDGEFEKCWYSPSCGSDDCITIYADRYGVTRLRDLHAEVRNDTDCMTDYFEKDSCRIDKTSRYWDEVRAAFCKQEIHNIKRSIKYYEKRGGAYYAEHIEEMRAKIERYQSELAA